MSLEISTQIERMDRLTCSARADCPRFHVIGIGPHQIAECTLVRNLLCTSNHADLVQSPDLRAQSTVDTQDLAVNDGAQGHEIEDLAAGLPYRRTSVFLEAFFVKPIHLCDLAGFVVATDQRDSIRIPKKGRCQPRPILSWEFGTHFALRQSNNVNVSKLKYPRST